MGCGVLWLFLLAVPLLGLLGGVVPAWCGAVVFVAGGGVVPAGRWVKGRKEKINNKINIPTQNIIYTTFKGWLYNIAKFLQK